MVFGLSALNRIYNNQGSTLTFQLTSLVASDNLDFTSQNNFSLAKGPTHHQKKMFQVDTHHQNDVSSSYTPLEDNTSSYTPSQRRYK